MFTRSRGTGGPNQNQNQNKTNYGAGRGSMLNPSYGAQNNSYLQQGNYQQNNTQKPPGNSMNQAFKGSAQQQHPRQPQQQQQQQHQQSQQQILQQQQQNIIQAQSQANQQQVGQPQRLKPILKQTPAAPPAQAPQTPAVQQQPAATMPAVEANDTNDETMSQVSTDQPKWKRIKVPGVKVNRKLKRLRMNQRLRKTLMPKNAIMVLNEMKAGVKFHLVENQAVPNAMFLVHAELEGKTYIGQGLSKPLARQNAAENALKSLLLEKMNAAAKKIKFEDVIDGSQPPSQGNQGTQDNTQIADDVSETGTIPMEVTGNEESDDIPWSSLASFALYKLFVEWQNQGSVVPIPRPGLQQPVKAKSEPKPPAEKKLPANAETIHPVMLLNQMKPGIVYTEVSRRGNPPNTYFTLAVDIDGKSFTGEAKNKKDAKKAAAKAALKGLFGLDYPAEAEESNQMQVQEITQ
ncbi:interleukin enhancer-binding factor 3 homolog isoform X2 [Microplitis mediator]|uniref:interleukin enhancer-binding factor 3 homolog isoform X2 n=1 Tax=Microplitis mediator TaxID=375433 RepID=UPI002554EDB6|nr:interleukin enhancer-binding factor 3 homolog isoform X2 [Microplitis mediator]